MTDNIIEQISSEIPEWKQKFYDFTIEISHKILKALEKNNMTQKTLAENIGVQESTVSKWLNGNHNYTIQTLAKIESFLNIELLSQEKENYDTKKRFATKKEMKKMGQKRIYTWDEGKGDTLEVDDYNVQIVDLNVPTAVVFSSGIALNSVFGACSKKIATTIKAGRRTTGVVVKESSSVNKSRFVLE